MTGQLRLDAPPPRKPLPFDVRTKPARGKTMLTVLIGCGATKLPTPAPARALYVGALFTSARLAAEAIVGEWSRGPARWWVLSAKHGTLHPDETVRPYNLHLTRLPQAEQQSWAGRTHDELVRRPNLSDRDAWERTWAGMVDPGDADANSIGSWSMYGGHHIIVSFAPAAYTAALAPSSRNVTLLDDWPVHRPLAGMGLGEQRGRLAAIRRDPAAFLDDPERGAA